MNSVKHRLQLDPQGIAEFANRDVDCDREHGFDDLWLGEMLVQPVPQILRQPIGVDADLHREI